MLQYSNAITPPRPALGELWVDIYDDDGCSCIDCPSPELDICLDCYQARPWGLACKALFDRLVAAVLLLLLLPILATIALVIMYDSAGAPLFRQRRTGWRGQLFTLYKFRTMHAQAASMGNMQTMRGDPRCTRIGQFLRRTSLDELPQLWNVLRGDMSLVGPRPHAEEFHVDALRDGGTAAIYQRRHLLKPGLTGWAQIHGARGALTNQLQLIQRVSYDLYYIDHWSFWLDLKIIALTPWVVLAGENAF